MYGVLNDLFLDDVMTFAKVVLFIKSLKDFCFINRSTKAFLLRQNIDISFRFFLTQLGQYKKDSSIPFPIALSQTKELQLYSHLV